MIDDLIHELESPGQDETSDPSLFGATPSGHITEAFGVPLGAGGGPAVTTTALSRKLAWLSDQGGQHNVILSSPAVPWAYTQCLVDSEDGIWIEAISNNYILPTEHFLGPLEFATLAQLGFAPPGEDDPNHWLVMAQPVDWSLAAALLIVPMLEVYGMHRSDLLIVEISPHLRTW